MSGEEGPGPFEGAGVVSSYADLAEALAADHVDPLQVLSTAAGAGLDTLGFVANPLDSLLTGGVGWLIEHVDFLSEPLDALAGDPDAIRDQAKAWHRVSVELTAVAADYRGEAALLSGGWDGDAARAYALAVERCIQDVDVAAAAAGEMSGIVLTSGAQVGTVRSLIRDAIAEFVAKVIRWVLAALATSAVTVGFSLAALVAAVVEQAVALARSCLHRISALLDVLDDAATTAARLGRSVQDTAAQIARSARSTADGIGSALADPAVVATSRRMAEVAGDAVGRAVPDGVEDALRRAHAATDRPGVPVVVEAAKQFTTEPQ
jgi:uncharacterized protein YukE